MTARASAVDGRGLDYFVCDVNDDTDNDINIKARTVRTVRTERTFRTIPKAFAWSNYCIVYVYVYIYVYSDCHSKCVCVHLDKLFTTIDYRRIHFLRNEALTYLKKFRVFTYQIL